MEILKSQMGTQGGAITTGHKRRVDEDSALQNFLRWHAHAPDLGRDFTGMRYEEVDFGLRPWPLKGEGLRTQQEIARPEFALMDDGHLREADLSSDHDVRCEFLDVPEQRPGAPAVKPPRPAGFTLK